MRSAEVEAIRPEILLCEISATEASNNSMELSLHVEKVDEGWNMQPLMKPWGKVSREIDVERPPLDWQRITSALDNIPRLIRSHQETPKTHGNLHLLKFTQPSNTVYLLLLH